MILIRKVLLVNFKSSRAIQDDFEGMKESAR